MARGRSRSGGEDAARAAESIRALEAGRLPVAAEGRVARGGPFATTLTASGFLNARSLDLEPVGQVLGASVMHFGFNPRWLYNAWHEGDIRPLSRAIIDARERALGRLREEARALGADGVVGVRLKAGRPAWGTELVEFTAVGTAVRFRGGRPADRFFLGNLSTVDARRLLAAGYVALDLVFATSAYYVLTTWGVELIGASYQNQEVGPYSAAVYRARDLVVGELSRQAGEVGAEGVLGSEWETVVEPVQVQRPGVDRWGAYGVGSYEDHILHVTVTGTAVGRMRAAEPIPAVKTVVDLGKGRGQ